MTPHYGINDTVLTYEDYRKTPDDPRYELLDGVLVILPTPNIAHQRALGDLLCELFDFLKDKKLGEAFMRVAVVLSNTNVVEPDITFVSAGRMDIIGIDDIQGAPDLVVEVISPSDPAQGLGAKAGHLCPARRCRILDRGPRCPFDACDGSGRRCISGGGRVRDGGRIDFQHAEGA